jgi:hypothetical protein
VDSHFRPGSWRMRLCLRLFRCQARSSSRCLGKVHHVQSVQMRVQGLEQKHNRAPSMVALGGQLLARLIVSPQIRMLKP